MADRSTFSMSRAIDLRANFSDASAWLTSRPRIRSITSLAFCADVRTYRAVACPSIMTSPRALSGPSCLRGRRGGRDGRGLLGLRGVALERPRRRELAQLVPHHVLGDVHRNEL